MTTSTAISLAGWGVPVPAKGTTELTIENLCYLIPGVLGKLYTTATIQPNGKFFSVGIGNYARCFSELVKAGVPEGNRIKHLYYHNNMEGGSPNVLSMQLAAVHPGRAVEGEGDGDQEGRDAQEESRCPGAGGRRGRGGLQQGRERVR